jgi:signal transduction histidine kinase
MLTKSHAPGGRSRLTTGLLVGTLVLIGLTIALAVVTTVTTSARARKEATEAVLLAQMQAALEQVAEQADGWMDRRNGGEAIDEFDVLGLAAVTGFRNSVAELQTMVDADEQRLFGQIAAGFEDYVRVTAAAVGPAEPESGDRFRTELARLENDLRSPILAVQLEENEHLLESIKAEEKAVLVLQILVPGLLILAALLSIFAVRSQSRKRRLEELESLHTAKDEFIASVSHELRTPLSAVLGLAAELRDNLARFDPDEIQELVTIIADQSQEVSLIVEDLLVSARLDDGNLTVVFDPVELHRQVENALVPFRAMVPGGCEVIGDALAYCDGARVRQILRNLIANAVRHGGDRVVVRIDSGEDAVTVAVKDNGLGLPPSEWETIFEAYHRTRDVPGLPPSVGLGLTVSRRLARQMAGDLSYRFADGWSRFELVLPASEPTPVLDPIAAPAR